MFSDFSTSFVILNLILIKLASVKLAMKYMKRVSAELELIVQGVKFAFRVHQVK
ncbi:hypothetical protein Bca52824_025259 [Brassica carinata]|uniref:Uncharacterized protein n=1 Tax=Brassica carinata TaxID=52824 RepID=A0A8X8AWL7_BRACI|nr:hypothetical protein Bca52824_025259 [Brassica carinata]